MDFDGAFERLIGHEGGYVNDPRDAGGETKFGISKRSYPRLDIKTLTLDDAKAIYKRDFWGPAGCDAVPQAIKFDLFDMAVNSGIKPAIKALQKACGADVDGILGPRTLAALATLPDSRMVARFNGARLAYMADATTWPAHGRGWARRIASNLLEA
jgi:lysozyme family protein